MIIYMILRLLLQVPQGTKGITDPLYTEAVIGLRPTLLLMNINYFIFDIVTCLCTTYSQGDGDLSVLFEYRMVSMIGQGLSYSNYITDQLSYDMEGV